jgi:hypothetical protein
MDSFGEFEAFNGQASEVTLYSVSIGTYYSIYLK